MDPTDLYGKLLDMRTAHGKALSGRRRIDIMSRSEADTFLTKFTYFDCLGRYSNSDSKVLERIDELLKTWDGVLVIADAQRNNLEVYVPRGEYTEAHLAKGACFIASAAYGSAFAPEVVTFRNFRDIHLARNFFGRTIISGYYATSPALASFIAKHPSVCLMVRTLLLSPLVWLLRLFELDKSNY